MRRYLANGSLDTTFGGGDGISTVDFNLFSDDRANGMVLDGHGQAVVVGSSDGAFALARFVLGPGAVAANRTSFDFDGDGRSDISVFRPSDSCLVSDRSTEGFAALQFGLSTDKIVPSDYDGDGKTDIAVYRPSSGVWYVLSSVYGTVANYQFGIAEDLPAPADLDGDGRSDLTVFRPSTGIWYSRHSSDNSFNSVQFGTNGDFPTVGDFDGDGNADLGVYRSV